MKLVKMECPYCGAELQVEEGKKIATCPYCRKNVAVDDEKKETIVTVKDEAKLQEASLKQQQYQDKHHRHPLPNRVGDPPEAPLFFLTKATHLGFKPV